jgi:hypothetical protein
MGCLTCRESGDRHMPMSGWFGQNASMEETTAGHLTSTFGPPSRSASFRWDTQDVAVYKWESERTGEGVDLYVTDSGAPPVAAGHVTEFFTGLTPGRDDIAGSLASLHRYQQVHGVLLGHGHTVPSDEPLWPDTMLNSMLILRQAVSIIPPLFTGSRHVEFLQVVPVTTPEHEAVHRVGVDAFLADWETRQIQFWDSLRT